MSFQPTNNVSSARAGFGNDLDTPKNLVHGTMILQHLGIRDFRNIAQLDLPWGENINLIVGGNGQGKSNLLEAIGLLASGRSFRRAHPETMVRRGTSEFFLKGHTLVQGIAHELSFHCRKNRLSARLDSKPMTTASALGEALAAVFFTPANNALFLDGPQERRRYLDWVTFTVDRRHAAVVRDYQKAVQARNQLLKQGILEHNVFVAWEQQIARLGAQMVHNRIQTLTKLQQQIGFYLTTLDLAQATLTMISPLNRLDPHWPQDLAGTEALYLDRLRHTREPDRRTGQTSVGPHRDDLLFSMDGADMGRFASQGQRKRFLLALTLTEHAIQAATLGTTPVFILDDPASELDQDGMQRLMDLLFHQDGQVFMTACEIRNVPIPAQVGQIFQVRNGHFEDYLPCLS